MKFTIDKSKLSDTIQSVLSVIPSKTTLPILGNFHLAVEKSSGLSIAATDLDLSMRARIEAKVTKDGSTTVPARMFSEIIRELPSGEVVCTVSGNRMEVKSGRGLYRLSGMSPDEFPKLPAVTTTRQIKIATATLATMIRKTLYAVSTDETRPALNGVLWQTKGEQMRMVATDGHRLSSYAVPESRLSGIKDDLILPYKALNLIGKMLDGDSEEIGIVFGEKNVSFVIGDTVVTSRLIEGPYPNFEQVIPAESDKSLSISADVLESGVRRVSVLSNALTKQVKFSLSQSGLELSATNADVGGEAKEALPCEYKGEDLEIGYNAGFILDMLKHLDTGNLEFKLSTSVSAGMVQGIDEQKNEYLNLIMPLRLSD